MNRWQISSVGILIGWVSLSIGCAAVPPCPSSVETDRQPTTMVPPSGSEGSLRAASPMSPATLALEHKVKLQEKRIAELSTQLQLLKRIDLDRNKH